MSYNFPALDTSLVLYYPMDTSTNIQGGFKTPNYASQLPVYDASMSGSSMITYANNTFITGLGDLSLNSIMGKPSLNAVVANNTFSINPSSNVLGVFGFSCSGQFNTTGTLISLPLDGNINQAIDIDISGTSTLCSVYNQTHPIISNLLVGTGGNLSIVTGAGITYQIFTTSGTFTVTNEGTLNYLIIAGGGGGGIYHAGGGGAGEVVSGTYNASVGNYTITVGNGGIGAVSNNSPLSTVGGNSSAFLITATGGGIGGGTSNGAATSGGSGGGGSGFLTSATAGTSTKINATGLGNAGGSGSRSINNPDAGAGGGGGGSGAPGQSAPNPAVVIASIAGNGGNGTSNYTGVLNNISTVMVTAWRNVVNVSGTYYIAAGGGGGSWGNVVAATSGYGGDGTGGTSGGNGSSCTANTGSGGGGAGDGRTPSTGNGGNGGSGLVVIWY